MKPRYNKTEFGSDYRPKRAEHHAGMWIVSVIFIALGAVYFSRYKPFAIACLVIGVLLLPPVGSITSWGRFSGWTRSFVIIMSVFAIAFNGALLYSAFGPSEPPEPRTTQEEVEDIAKGIILLQLKYPRTARFYDDKFTAIAGKPNTYSYSGYYTADNSFRETVGSNYRVIVYYESPDIYEVLDIQIE